MIWDTTFSIICIGMARPMPADWPWPRLLPRPVAMAVFIPITRPWMSVSGPPLLPGLMAASTWMKFSYSMSASPAVRPTPETMPLDMLKRKSNGLPNANTRSPCSGISLERWAGRRSPPLTSSTAMSVLRSTPTRRAGMRAPSWSCTSMRCAPSPRWR